MKSLDAIFKPRSIAVVGATMRRGSIGREILRSLFEGEFNGKIFPVNPKYEYLHSTKSYPTVGEIPDEVDLAVIVVPKDFVIAAAQDCGKKGVKGLVIISAGFREVGPEGAERESQLLAVAEKYGMRMIGPNCMGVINATPAVRMNATFAPGSPPPGSLAFMTQSGALGVAILIAAQKLNMGISYFASVGNKADISAIDLLEYWEDDDDAGVIALYLESFGDPGRFTELSKRISKHKPIVAVKSGTSAAGQAAASSHTGALAGLEVAVEALLRQCGVLRVSTIEEMIDLVSGLGKSPLPQGERLCILTNAGGPGIMAADAVEDHGLKMAELSDATQSALKTVLPAEASLTNPVDMVASAGPEQYDRSLDIILRDDNVDMAIVIFVPPLMIEPMEVAARVTRVAREHGKPVFMVLMAEEKYYEMIPRQIEGALPVYRFTESAVKVAGEMNRHRCWQEEPSGEVRTFPAEREAAQAALVDKSGYLSADDVATVLRSYGFPLCGQTLVPVGADVETAAASVGFPLVLKVEGEGIVHKSDIGGVALDIRTPEELRAAQAEMETKLRAAGVLGQVRGYLVQEMAKPGKEVILGVMQDAKFGPLLMFGMGGKYVEVIRDIAFRVMPVTDIDAWKMVKGIKSYPLLEGVRGEEGVDIEFVVELIERLAQMVTELDGIAELDMNPVVVTPDRADSRVVDARIRVR